MPLAFWASGVSAFRVPRCAHSVTRSMRVDQTSSHWNGTCHHRGGSKLVIKEVSAAGSTGCCVTKVAREALIVLDCLHMIRAFISQSESIYKSPSILRGKNNHDQALCEQPPRPYPRTPCSTSFPSDDIIPPKHELLALARPLPCLDPAPKQPCTDLVETQVRMAPYQS